MENRESYGFIFHKFRCMWIVNSSMICLGVDRTAKIGVSGDSAGAMISASVSQTLKTIDFQVLIFILSWNANYIYFDYYQQILIYGVYDFSLTAPRNKEFDHPQYFGTSELMLW